MTLPGAKDCFSSSSYQKSLLPNAEGIITVLENAVLFGREIEVEK